MGTIFVDNLKHQSSQGSGTITIGASGETINIPTGSTIDLSNSTVTLNSSMKSTPSFQAYLSSNQSIGVNTTTTVAIDTEEFDTDSAFNVSNYRFTVPSGKAGKYFFYGGITMANFFAYAVAEIAKNGSAIRRGVAIRNDASGVTVNALADLSVGDYITLSAYQDQSGQVLQSNSNFTYFGGFRLIG